MDWLAWKVSRVRCRLFRRHDLYCRGRSDHVRGGRIIDPERWSS